MRVAKERGEKKNTHPCHDRKQEKEQALPVFLHVRLGQLHSDRKHAHGQDDPSDLERDLIDGVI